MRERLRASRAIACESSAVGSPTAVRGSVAIAAATVRIVGYGSGRTRSSSARPGREAVTQTWILAAADRSRLRRHRRSIRRAIGCCAASSSAWPSRRAGAARVDARRPLAYNPYAHGSDSEIPTRRSPARRSEPHYLRLAQRYLGHAVRTMRAADVPISPASLMAHMDPGCSSERAAAARGGGYGRARVPGPVERSPAARARRRARSPLDPRRVRRRPLARPRRRDAELDLRAAIAAMRSSTSASTPTAGCCSRRCSPPRSSATSSRSSASAAGRPVPTRGADRRVRGGRRRDRAGCSAAPARPASA